MDAAIGTVSTNLGEAGIDFDEPVAMHPLIFLDEGDEVTVGRSDIDSYCVLPADGAALLRELTRGVPPGAAARWYGDTYGESVDVAEFLAAMEELGFLAAPGETPVAAVRLRWQRLGRAVFSPPAWILYAILLLTAAVAMTRHHDLYPHYENLFFTPYLTVVLLVGFVGQLPLILLHEAFHALAGRRLGLGSRLGIGRRLYFVVVQTSLDGLVAVPRRKRYLPILAGMLADLLIIAVLTLAAAVTRVPDGGQPLFGAVCLALAFAVVPRFLWQFYFYLETDLYQMFITVLGCVDLQRTTRRLIGNRVNRRLGRRHALLDESSWHPRDRQVARWYSWLLIVGYAVSASTLLFIGLPTIVRAFTSAFDRVGGSWLDATDSLVFLVVTIGQLVVAAVLGLRQRRARRTSPVTAHVIN